MFFIHVGLHLFLIVFAVLIVNDLRTNSIFPAVLKLHQKPSIQNRCLYRAVNFMYHFTPNTKHKKFEKCWHSSISTILKTLRHTTVWYIGLYSGWPQYRHVTETSWHSERTVHWVYMRGCPFSFSSPYQSESQKPRRGSRPWPINAHVVLLFLEC